VDAFEEAQSVMTQKQIRWDQSNCHQLLKLIVVAGIFVLFPISVLAQLIPIADDTLGNERASLSSDRVINNLPSNQIDGGAQRGANLFHSFREFNIDVGRGVYFTNPAGVANIFTRVTGGNESQILGTLGVLGTANLFLLNPNGILFGPNAQLDVRGGSFVASTANSLLFDNGFAFSATDPQVPTLLTINVPIGLQYGRNPGAIQSQGAGLQVPDGQTLTLAGGDVTIDGQGLQSSGGRVELGGVSAAGTLGFNRDGSLSFPKDLARADVSLINAARVVVSAGGGGSIAINARNLEVREGSQLLAGIGEGLGTPTAQAEDITINASNTVVFNRSNAFNDVNFDSVGNAGNVSITTGSLEVLNGSALSSDVGGRGDGGRVIINAADTVEFDQSIAASRVFSRKAVGNARGISITTGSLKLLNGAQLDSSTYGVGNAGSINIEAKESVLFDGKEFTGAFSEILKGQGDGGNITVTTGSLTVKNGALISARNSGGLGNAGGVNITARDAVTIAGFPGNTGGTIVTDVRGGGIGNASDLSITARAIEIKDRAIVAASIVSGKGKDGTLAQSGNVNLKATETISISDNSVVFSEVGAGSVGNGGTMNISAPIVALKGASVNTQLRTGGQGKAGDINIFTTELLRVTNGGQLATATRGQGNAGNINISGSQKIIFDGVGDNVWAFGNDDTTPDINRAFTSGAFTTVGTTAIGNAGGIFITTDSLELTNRARLSASTRGNGDAGKIEIIANTFEASNGGQLLSRTSSQFSAGNIILQIKNDITLFGTGTGIFANTTEDSTGRGGSIFIDPQRVLVQDGATISVNSQGRGIGGNIFLQADHLELRNRGSITAETASAQGGNIRLDIKDVLGLRRNSLISTTAGTAQAGGDGGNIIFNGKFIVAVPKEDSDISANAFTGKGGSVEITAQNLFGIQFRPQETNLSDITASSRFGAAGVVAISKPDIDPNQGLLQLPTDLTDASRLIAQTCPTVDTIAKTNQFIITGRGGLPPTPSEAVNRDAIQVDLVTVNQDDSSRPDRATVLPRSPDTPIVEAQGAQIAANGMIKLVATAPTHSPADIFHPRAHCH
jgi:filamentous hemagglutinin family protein